MSNVAVFNPSQLPAFARKGELSELAKALAGGGGNGGKRISIKGGVFRLIADGKEVAAIDERFLDVVIVKAAPKVARTFYAAKWDPEAKAVPPTCWSPDGEKPDPKSTTKQADTCASCPQNIAGSGQGQSRACRYQQRMAAVLAGDIEGDVMQLSLPATSIFGKEEGDNRPLQAYARWLVAQNVDPSMVVTRMRFDTKSESPKVFFKAMRWLTDEEFAQATEQGKTPDAAKAVAMDVFVIENVKPADAMTGTRPTAPKAAPEAVEEEAEEEAPAPAPKPKAKPKAKPAPVAEEVEEEAEPTVKKAAEKPLTVPGKKSLADVVSDWDDE